MKTMEELKFRRDRAQFIFDQLKTIEKTIVVNLRSDTYPSTYAVLHKVHRLLKKAWYRGYYAGIKVGDYPKEPKELSKLSNNSACNKMDLVKSINKTFMYICAESNKVLVSYNGSVTEGMKAGLKYFKNKSTSYQLIYKKLLEAQKVGRENRRDEGYFVKRPFEYRDLYM